MAEDDDRGDGLSDFIDPGNRLMAEFRPQDKKYGCVTSGRINSNRMITAAAGTAACSAAFDPFGGIQKTRVNPYDPALKFPGKEREPPNGMGCSGARHYPPDRYRCLSPDPVLNRDAARSDPQPRPLQK